MAGTLNKPINNDYKNQLIECAQAFGGKNYFLQLLEAIRETRPHPLMAKNAEFHFSMGTIKWKKVIYKDKVHLLLNMLKDNRYNGNLMPRKGDKGYKTKMNLLRTLGPMEFEVRPKNTKDGNGFVLHPFDIIDKNTTRLNYIFNAVFFIPVHKVKKELTS
jgi:hypothetical protein